MITLKVKLGDQETAGLTFTVLESRIDTIYSIISAVGLSNQVSNIWFENEDEKVNLFNTLAADLTTGLTLSITLQADSDSDIDFYDGTGMSLKHVLVELVS